jgi:hypothetical protein
MQVGYNSFMSKKNPHSPWWKVLATDTLGVLLLILVPFLGPLPGPGGIPLLIAGFGLLAINHDWADGAVDYVKTHSESFRKVIFPDITWVKWSWDIFAIFLLVGGTWLNIIATDSWLLKGLSIAVMASSTTLFMLNRDRISALDKFLRRTGKN